MPAISTHSSAQAQKCRWVVELNLAQFKLNWAPSGHHFQASSSWVGEVKSNLDNWTTAVVITHANVRQNNGHIAVAALAY